MKFYNPTELSFGFLVPGTDLVVSIPAFGSSNTFNPNFIDSRILQQYCDKYEVILDRLSDREFLFVNRIKYKEFNGEEEKEPVQEPKEPILVKFKSSEGLIFPSQVWSKGTYKQGIPSSFKIKLKPPTKKK